MWPPPAFSDHHFDINPPASTLTATTCGLICSVQCCPLHANGGHVLLSAAARRQRRFVPPAGQVLEPYLADVFPTKNGCFKASDGVIRLSGFNAKHRSSKSMKWLRSRDSASLMSLEATVRRVRRSRVGFTTAMVRTFVCSSKHQLGMRFTGGCHARQE